ncbi:hypothetical protein JYK04_08189 [Streptomyces nojiriensis]|nr:hypothetical protein JYK04_08189 [Streptomyces nojiriensis]
MYGRAQGARGPQRPELAQPAVVEFRLPHGDGPYLEGSESRRPGAGAHRAADTWTRPTVSGSGLPANRPAGDLFKEFLKRLPQDLGVFQVYVVPRFGNAHGHCVGSLWEHGFRLVRGDDAGSGCRRAPCHRPQTAAPLCRLCRSAQFECEECPGEPGHHERQIRLLGVGRLETCPYRAPDTRSACWTRWSAAGWGHGRPGRDCHQSRALARGRKITTHDPLAVGPGHPSGGQLGSDAIEATSSVVRHPQASAGGLIRPRQSVRFRGYSGP